MAMPSQPQNLLCRCCPKAGNSKEMGMGPCLACPLFLSPSPGMKTLPIVHIAVVASPGNHPKWHRDGETCPPEEEEPNWQPWNLKNVLPLPNSFVEFGEFFFLNKFCFKQCQPLTFSLYAHSTFKPANTSLVYKTLNVTHMAHAPH